MDPATISLIIGGAVQVYKLVQAYRALKMQKGEWTPEQEAAFAAGMDNAFTSAAWRPSR